MNFDTDTFRAIAAKSENALLALADTFANAGDTKTMLAILPVFLEMKESDFYKVDRSMDVIHNGVTSTIKTSFVKAFEKALWPVEDAPRWTSDQNQLFDGLKPFLHRNDQAGITFVSEAARKVTDPRVIEAVNFDKKSLIDLLERAASESNASIFAALVSKLNKEAAAEWIVSVVPGLEDSGVSGFTSRRGFVKLLEQREGSAAITELVSKVDEVHGDQFRMEMLSLPMIAQYEAAKPILWTPEGIARTMGADSLSKALAIVKVYADEAAGQKSPDEVAAAMGYSKGLPVHRLMKAALRGNCAPLLEAGESLFRKGSALIDPFPWVFESPLQSPDNLKSTIATLAGFGFPLGNESVTLGQRPRVCALEHLAKLQGDPAGVETKLVALLNAGANPSVPNHLNKTPVALVKNKAERDRWNSVIKSRTARNSAMALIEEMDAETAGPSP